MNARSEHFIWLTNSCPYGSFDYDRRGITTIKYTIQCYLPSIILTMPSCRPWLWYWPLGVKTLSLWPWDLLRLKKKTIEWITFYLSLNKKNWVNNFNMITETMFRLNSIYLWIEFLIYMNWPFRIFLHIDDNHLTSLFKFNDRTCWSWW